MREEVLIETGVSRRLKAQRRARKSLAFYGRLMRDEALTASRAHPRALVLWLELRRMVHMRYVQPLAIGDGVLSDMGIQPKTADRALAALERVGLIRVERQRGRLPRIWLLQVGGSDPTG